MATSKLPFDINAPLIEIKDVDYAIWYRDMNEELEKYIGKELQFKAMIAFDKETGKEVWRWDMDNYTWSSPVAVYTEAGEGYLVSFDSQGGGFLLDGATGEILDTTDVGSLVEASPVVYENRLVVGTRGQLILGMDLQ